MGAERFAVVASLLVLTALLLHARTRLEKVPTAEKLDTFPLKLAGWSGRDLPLDAETLKVLGPGDFLSRIYTSDAVRGYNSLFIAYFPSQRAGDTIHSPQNCLPGSGWTPIDFRRVELRDSQNQLMPVNRYVIAKGLDRQMVLYWYQAHGRVVASEYWAKFYLIADSIRLNRTDGALIRVITPIAPGEGARVAEQRAAAFAHEVVAPLEPHIPR